MTLDSEHDMMYIHLSKTLPDPRKHGFTEV